MYGTRNNNDLFKKTEELIKEAKIQSRIKQEKEEIEIEKLQNKLEAHKGWIRCSEKDKELLEKHLQKYCFDFKKNEDRDVDYLRFLDDELRAAKMSIQRNKGNQNQVIC